jgi:hypothetical protein
VSARLLPSPGAEFARLDRVDRLRAERAKLVQARARALANERDAEREREGHEGVVRALDREIDAISTVLFEELGSW